MNAPAITPIETLRTYSLRQVADLAGVHVVTLRRRIRAGKLQAVRLGKGFRLPHDIATSLLAGK